MGVLLVQAIPACVRDLSLVVTSSEPPSRQLQSGWSGIFPTLLLPHLCSLSQEPSFPLHLRLLWLCVPFLNPAVLSQSHLSFLSELFQPTRVLRLSAVVRLLGRSPSPMQSQGVGSWAGG